MQLLLMRCNDIYLKTACCHNETNMICNCYKCLSYGFYSGDDSYSCLKKLCYYTMNYGPAFVSEIYHFFSFSEFLEKNFKNRSINILSLGCGFCPEIIALNKYISDNSLNLKIQYVGLDIENNWNKIRDQYLGDFYTQDVVLNGFDVSGYEIVFINKVFSTLKNKNQDDAFLDILQYQIENNLAQKSFIFFHDVNHRNMGRDKFHGRVSRIINSVGRYFYNISGAYTGDYTQIPYNHNICQIPRNLRINPLQNVTKSVIFLYQQ